MWGLSPEGKETCVYSTVIDQLDVVNQSGYDIGIGKNGIVWVIGGDYGILQFRSKSEFKKMEAKGNQPDRPVCISVDDKGVPWVIDSAGSCRPNTCYLLQLHQEILASTTNRGIRLFTLFLIRSTAAQYKLVAPTMSQEALGYLAEGGVSVFLQMLPTL